MSPIDRERLITALDICHSPTCTAHDRLLEAILVLEEKAFQSGQDSMLLGGVG